MQYIAFYVISSFLHLLKGYDKEMYETKKENTKNLMKLLQQQNALAVECVGV